MADYTLSVKLDGDASELKKEMASAEQAVSGATKSVSGTSKASKAAKAALGGVAKIAGTVTTAMGSMLGMGVKYNAEIESYQTSFEVMTGSAEKAQQTVETLKKMGAETPFDLPQLADTTQLLMNYGFTADDAIDKMTMLGDISQGSADKMSRIATAYGQMSSAGKVQLEDVKQMIEAGFNPLQEISQSTGESMASLYDRISKGTLSVDEITASMERSTSAGGKYFQSMEKQSQTFSGQLSTLKDNAQQLVGSLANDISGELTGKVLPTLNSGLSQMAAALAAGDMAGFATAGGQMIGNLLTGIVQQLPQLLSVGLTIVQSLLSSLQTNMPAIAASAVSIITTLVTSLLGMLPQIIDIGFSIIVSLAQGITQQLPALIPEVVNILLEIVDTLTNPDSLSMLVGVALDLIFTLAQGLITAIPKLISAVPKIIQNVVSTLLKLLPKLLPVALELIVTLATGLISYIPTLLTYIPQIITAIIGAFSKQDWGQIGRDIIDGLINGLKSMLSSLANAAESIAKSVGDTFKDLLGIGSPSKVFMQYGVWTDEGYAIGLDKGTKKIESAFQNMDVTGTFTATLPTSRDFTAANTAPVSSYSTDLGSLGSSLGAANAENMNAFLRAVERGIGSMKVVANNREVGRFMTDIGFRRANA